MKFLFFPQIFGFFPDFGQFWQSQLLESLNRRAPPKTYKYTIKDISNIFGDFWRYSTVGSKNNQQPTTAYATGHGTMAGNLGR